MTISIETGAIDAPELSLRKRAIYRALICYHTHRTLACHSILLPYIFCIANWRVPRGCGVVGQATAGLYHVFANNLSINSCHD